MNTGSWLEELGTPAFRDSLVARAPRVAVWVIALCLGIQAALIVTRLAGAGHAPGPRAAQLPTPRAALDIARLANAHLFGEPPALPSDDADAPQTNMPLVLTGIIAGHTPRDGLAILGANANSTRVYAVGQRVPGNATVHAVYEDRVLLDRAGSIEALTLPRKLSHGAGRPLPQRMSAVSRVQRALDNQPGLLGDVLRPQPVFVDGHQRGYRVYPGRNAQAFASLGLRNGDLVTAINGTPLDDPNHGTDILQTLSSSDQARVTVMRNGQQQELTLDMSQIASQAEQLATGNTNATSAGQNGGSPQVPAAQPRDNR